MSENSFEAQACARARAMGIGRHAVAIVANGDAPSGEAELFTLREAAHVVCCDGACCTVKKLGIKPDCVVGDGDSIADRDRLALGERFVLCPDQNTNDLDKAFHFALTHYGADKDYVFLGLTGKREDHTIGNLFRLPRYAALAQGNVSAVTPTGTVYAFAHDFSLQMLKPGQQVSVFAPYAGMRLMSEGLKWPLDDVDLTNLWAGTLNEMTDESLVIRGATPLRPAMVYVLNPTCP